MGEGSDEVDGPYGEKTAYKGRHQEKGGGG